MRIETLHRYFLESTGICTDTRKITKGCLFFCLKGDNFNGNTFTQAALDKGAYKVIIDEIQFHKNTGETIICKNAITLLQKLASFHRAYLKLPIIALTGSNGKTTTKELINAVLSQHFNTVATRGNLNNHIGVPLTLLSMTESTEIGIVEMGANHLKEIEKLCNIVSPDYGYITNFGKAHLEGFGSIQGVIKGKNELYQHLQMHGKIVFVNAHDTTQMQYSKGIQRITFGNDQQDCHVRLKDASNKLIVIYKDIKIQSNLIGLYNFHNIAAAIAIGDYFKVPVEKIKKAIEEYIPNNNRSQLLEKGPFSIILDAYNANPTSMMAAIENFKQANGKHKILFLGDMFELGNDAELEHQHIASYLAENAIGVTYLIGSNFFKTETNAAHIHKMKTYEHLQQHLEKHPYTEGFLLIKASRGMALERILELL